MESMRNVTDLKIIPDDEEKEGDHDGGSTGTIQSYTVPIEPYTKRYLMKNWHKFRNIGRLIMKNGWYIPHVWKAYMEY